MPGPTTVRHRALRFTGSRLVGTAAVVLALLALADAEGLAALQRMAGYEAEQSMFGQIRTYLNNLRDSLIPLAIPLAAIGLTGGGVAYMVGNVMAQKILGGVVIGAALTLMAPSIVA
jgi:hypothetical protein